MTVRLHKGFAHYELTDPIEQPRFADALRRLGTGDSSFIPPAKEHSVAANRTIGLHLETQRCDCIGC